MKRKELKKQNKLEIVNAAIECFIGKGITNTSIEDIVKLTSLARGTFYNYFDSKDEVWNYIITQIINEIYTSANSVYGAANSFEEYFYYAYLQGLEIIRKDPIPALITANQVQFREAFKANPELLEIAQRNLSNLSSKGNTAKKPESYNKMLVYIMTGAALEIIIYSHINNDDISNEEIAQYMTQLIMTGINK